MLSVPVRGQGAAHSMWPSNTTSLLIRSHWLALVLFIYPLWFVSEFMCSCPAPRQNSKLREARPQAWFPVLPSAPGTLKSALRVRSAQLGFLYVKPSRLCLSQAFQILKEMACLKDCFPQSKPLSRAPSRLSSSE